MFIYLIFLPIAGDFSHCGSGKLTSVTRWCTNLCMYMCRMYVVRPAIGLRRLHLDVDVQHTPH